MYILTHFEPKQTIKTLNVMPVVFKRKKQKSQGCNFYTYITDRSPQHAKSIDYRYREPA